MPTYQYQCTECGEPLEAVQKFTDDALTECPSCQGRLRKVFSAVGVVFKGSGFYRNDSRSSSSAGGSAKSDGSGGGESKSSSKAETKSEPKTESKSESKAPAKSESKTPAAASTGSGTSTT